MWTCTKCREQIEDSFDSCWSCGTARDGTPPANPILFQEDSRESATTITKRATGEQSPSQFIEMVRKRSCYRTLRDLIDIICLISIVVTVIAGVVYLIGGVAAGSPIVVVVGIAITALACVLVIAGKQVSLLLIDIADTLIEQNRKKKRGSRENAQPSD